MSLREYPKIGYFVCQEVPAMSVQTCSRIRVATMLVLAALVGGCEATNRQLMSADTESAGPMPARYRQIAAEFFRKALVDPYSVRDAEISKPKMGSLFVEGTLGKHEPGWLVCLRANSKNRMGAYTGLRDTAIVIRGDVVRASLSDPDNTHYIVKKICGEEAYEPFSELEQESGNRSGGKR